MPPRLAVGGQTSNGEDFVDTILAQWERQDHGGADLSPMHVISRLLRLSAWLERDMQRRFRHHGLHMGDFDVLATLYRHGAPYARHPQQLTQQLLLSSDALTYRLDSLEKHAPISRIPNLDDRRSVFLRLTDCGRHTLLAALQTDMQAIAQVLAPLAPIEATQLAKRLRCRLHHQQSAH